MFLLESVRKFNFFNKFSTVVVTVPDLVDYCGFKIQNQIVSGYLIEYYPQSNKMFVK